MARPRNNQKHLATAAEDLVKALTRFVTLAGDAMQASKGAGGEVSNARRPKEIVAHGKPRGPGKGNPKLKAKLKSYWASMTPEQRKARIAKMHAWRKK